RHAFPGSLDGWEECQDASHEDARGHGEIRPSEGDPERHVLQQRQGPPSISPDERDGSPGKLRGMFERGPVVEQAVHRLPEALAPRFLLAIATDRLLEPLALAALELAQNIIDHLIGFHGVTRPRGAWPTAPSAGASPARHASATSRFPPG